MDSKSVGGVVKTMSKGVDSAMKDGLFEMAGLGVDAIKDARDYLAKTIKKMITNRNLDLDSDVKEAVYDEYVTFVEAFEDHYYD
jgi:hypothetical protein